MTTNTGWTKKNAKFRLSIILRKKLFVQTLCSLYVDVMWGFSFKTYIFKFIAIVVLTIQIGQIQKDDIKFLQNVSFGLGYTIGGSKNLLFKQ